ncbi:MAG: response regulator transcription factor [Chitinophagales bacterium]|nr:response regulator transcription factor [Chitinophagales bacterium]
MDKSGLKILIVEDDLIIAENLKENLDLMGYGQIFHAHNSDRGIAIFKDIHPDLCLVDIHLQGSTLDGIDMVLSEDMGRAVPVIYLTSFADEAIRSRAKKTNPAGYLIKPASKIQIDVAIDIALSTFYKKRVAEESPKTPISVSKDFVFLKVKTANYECYEKFNLRDITYIKAEGSYAHVHAGHKSTLVSMTLTKILEALNHSELIRCHRSYAVNIMHVHAVDYGAFFVLNDGVLLNVPIGEQYRSDVHARLHKV